MSFYTLKKLPYSFDALEPFIDAKTMELHYTKHHNGYFSKFSAAIEQDNISPKPVVDILSEISKYSAGIRNNGGGYWNHEFFWETMAAPKSSKISDNLKNTIIKRFGNFESFKDSFFKIATSHFGSGWAWIILDSNKQLNIVSTPNQDNPIMDISKYKGTPILGLDVWEHAYYLKYQNRRPEYVAAFWEVINWNKVSERFELLK